MAENEKDVRLIVEKLINSENNHPSTFKPYNAHATANMLFSNDIIEITYRNKYLGILFVPRWSSKKHVDLLFIKNWV